MTPQAAGEVFSDATGGPDLLQVCLWPALRTAPGFPPAIRPIPLSSFMQLGPALEGDGRADTGIAQPISRHSWWGFLEFMFLIDEHLISGIGKIRRASFGSQGHKPKASSNGSTNIAIARIIPTF